MIQVNILDDVVNPKFRAGILGATGVVGQKFVSLLTNHKWIEIVALGASEKSAGLKYKHACSWREVNECPENIGELIVLDAQRDLTQFIAACDLVFSALEASVAERVEPFLAEAGLAVFSNASSHRYHHKVPIVIPTVNAEHIYLVYAQDTSKSGGFIICNSNCTTAGIVTALKPLQTHFGLKSFICTTLQACSGAGLPGPHWDAINDNVICDIPNEEYKISTEVIKVLGTLDVLSPHRTDDLANVYSNASIKEFSDLRISASCTRVPVVDGHTISCSVGLVNPPRDENGAVDIEKIKSVFEDYTAEVNHLNRLPTMPKDIIKVFSKPEDPQPKRHCHQGKGMTVCLGKVRECAVLDAKFNIVVNNTVLGAAGGSIANAELAIASGILR